MIIERLVKHDIRFNEIGAKDGTRQGFVIYIDGIPVIDAGFFQKDLTISLRTRTTDQVFLKEIEPFVDDETGTVIDRRFQLVSMPKIEEIY